MRWSKLFIPTLRDAPADAEAPSHALLVRGGFIRQLHAGHYSMLPLGWKVHQKVAAIVRQEMDAIGGQEFSLPTMHPARNARQTAATRFMTATRLPATCQRTQRLRSPAASWRNSSPNGRLHVVRFET